jgi:hypothetical protein
MSSKKSKQEAEIAVFLAKLYLAKKRAEEKAEQESILNKLKADNSQDKESTSTSLKDSSAKQDK